MYSSCCTGSNINKRRLCDSSCYHCELPKSGMGATNGMDGWRMGCALFSCTHLDVTIEMVKPAADGLISIL